MHRKLNIEKSSGKTMTKKKFECRTSNLFLSLAWHRMNHMKIESHEDESHEDESHEDELHEDELNENESHGRV